MNKDIRNPKDEKQDSNSHASQGGIDFGWGTSNFGGYMRYQ